MYSRQLSLHLLPGNWDTQFNKHRDQIVTALSVRERRKKGKRGAMYTHNHQIYPKVLSSSLCWLRSSLLSALNTAVFSLLFQALSLCFSFETKKHNELPLSMVWDGTGWCSQEQKQLLGHMHTSKNKHKNPLLVWEEHGIYSAKIKQPWPCLI